MPPLLVPEPLPDVPGVDEPLPFVGVTGLVMS